MLRYLVLAAAALALVVTAIWTLDRRQPELVGGNGVRPLSFVATVPPHKPLCTGLGWATSRPDRLRLTLATNGAAPPPLRLAFTGGQATTIVRYREGVVDVPLPAGVGMRGGSVCVESLGQHAVLVAGEAGGGATLAGRPQPYAVSLGLVSGHPPTWAVSAGRVLRHVGAARAGAGGPVTGWIALALLCGALAGALVVAARWVR